MLTHAEDSEAAKGRCLMANSREYMRFKSQLTRRQPLTAGAIGNVPPMMRSTYWPVKGGPTMPRCPNCEAYCPPDPETGYDGADYCSAVCEDEHERRERGLDVGTRTPPMDVEPCSHCGAWSEPREHHPRCRDCGDVLCVACCVPGTIEDSDGERLAQATCYTCHVWSGGRMDGRLP